MIEHHVEQDGYILEIIQSIRTPEAKPQPPEVAEFNEKYTGYCRQRARAEYQEHGQWFFCEDRHEYGTDIRWDEVITFQVYWQLLSRCDSFEDLPNYSEENRRRTIVFWQGWQREDGSFYNIYTRSDDPKDCNGKYIPGILTLLGSQPRYKTAHGGAAQLDSKTILREISERKMNSGTAKLPVLFERIHDGETQLIPALERAVELALTQLSPQTGMFHGPDMSPADGTWSDYGTTAESMKGLLRLLGFLGVENLPYRHVRADRLLANQEWFRRGEIPVKRNTAEMFVQCLLESAYRGNELLEALDKHSRVILSGNPWTTPTKGDYAAYVLLIFGSYLHWHGYEDRLPRNSYHLGIRYDRRIEVGPFGRCANIIMKRSEELISQKGWSYEKYGLRARNAFHEKRKVIDIVPASAEGWTFTADEAAGASATRTFTLDPVRLQNPYIKIKWTGGDMEILLNAVPVKKKLGGLPDFGAVHIPEGARKALRTGENTLTVRSISPNDTLSLSAGLIDWSLEAQ